MQGIIRRSLAVLMASALVSSAAVGTGIVFRDSTAPTVSAAEVTENTSGANAESDFTYSVNNVHHYVTINKYKGKNNTVVIPAKINGLPVLTIGSDAFKDSAAISITVPDIVEEISSYAFSCTSLKEIKIGKGVSSISDTAFLGAKSLEKIIVSINNENFASKSGVLYNKDMTCLYCVPAKKEGIMTVPDSVTRMSSFAFSDAEEITQLNWPSSMPYITSYYIRGLVSLKKIVLPSSTYQIDDGTFKTFTQLTEIAIKDNNGENFSVENGILFNKNKTELIAYPRGKKGAYTIPSTVKKIRSYAFYRMEDLTAVTLPEGIQSIGDYNFYKVGIKYIRLPESLTEVGEICFYNCDSLTTIRGGVNLTSVGKDSFLSNDKVDKATPDGIIYVGSAVLGYKGTMPANTALSFKKAAKCIADNAFEEKRNISSVTLSDNIVKVGQRAFLDCKGLNTLVIGKNTVLDQECFAFCYSLKNISISEGVKELGYGCFNQCIDLESIKLPESVTRIGGYAFFKCEKLKSINFPSKLREIGKYALNGTEWISKKPDGIVYEGSFALEYKGTIPENTTITFRNGTKYLAGNMFEYSDNIVAVVIPEGVTTIPEGIFKSCYNLASVKLPSTVTTLEEDCFYNCVELKNINLPASLKTIGANAFCECNSLEKVTLPSSLVSLGDQVFAGCNNIRSIVIPSSVRSVGATCFADCSNLRSLKVEKGLTKLSVGMCAMSGSLTEVTLPEGLKTIEIGAFFGCNKINIIRIPSTVTKICALSLDFGGKASKSSADNKGYIIYGTGGTAAETYAKECGMTFRNVAAAPSAVNLSKTSLKMGVKETCTLKAVVIPDYIDNKTVTWSTSNSSVVTVKNGKLTAVKTGTAEITAKTSNGKKAVCKVTVKNAPSKVTLSKTSKTIGVGEIYGLKATLPDGTASYSMTWTSGNTSVATVSNGQITAKKTGTTTITVKTFNGKTASCRITVKNAPSKITLSKTAKTIGVGEVYELTATLPDGTASGTRTWTSNNTAVATVKDGKVTALKTGTAIITVKTFNNKTASCTITVKKAPARVSISPATATVKVGGTYNLTAVLPADTASGVRKWSSSNSAVATVKDGKVTGIKKGTATITVKTFNGKTATCKVTVK